MKLKARALDPNLLRKAGDHTLAKAIEKMGGKNVQQLTEASEIFARTSAVIGGLRQGMPLEAAVSGAKAAHVPYEQMTSFERNVMKRTVLYYSFPRHYIPFAWKKFGENPGSLSPLINSIRNTGLFTTQLISDINACATFSHLQQIVWLHIWELIA